MGGTARYSFFIPFDDAEVCSVVDRPSEPPAKPMTKIVGCVNLIKAFWSLPSGEEEAERLRPEMGVEDAADEGEEPVEGCKMYDVGWRRRRMSVDTVMPEMYERLPGAREENYVRPNRLQDGRIHAFSAPCTMWTSFWWT